MRYLKVAWHHDRADEPVLLYSECDDEGWEVRKVEVFRDGRIGYAGSADNAGGTALGERPTPDLAEITNQAEFDPTLITRREFEKVWTAARARRSLATSH